MASPLEQATQLIATAQMDLEMRGYPRQLVRIGLDRALGTAISRVAAVGPQIRQQAFLDTLRDELRGVEKWIKQELAFVNTP